MTGVKPEWQLYGRGFPEGWGELQDGSGVAGRNTTFLLGRSQMPCSDRLKVKVWHQNTCDAQRSKWYLWGSMPSLRITDQEQSRGHTRGLQHPAGGGIGASVPKETWVTDSIYYWAMVKSKQTNKNKSKVFKSIAPAALICWEDFSWPQGGSCGVLELTSNSGGVWPFSLSLVAKNRTWQIKGPPPKDRNYFKLPFVLMPVSSHLSQALVAREGSWGKVYLVWALPCPW